MARTPTCATGRADDLFRFDFDFGTPWLTPASESEYRIDADTRGRATLECVSSGRRRRAAAASPQKVENPTEQRDQ